MKLQVREVTTGLKFPEGPIAMPDGSVLVVEIEGTRLVRVQLDGSRRWVTLSGVDDGLAEAVISSRAEDRRRDVEPSLHG